MSGLKLEEKKKSFMDKMIEKRMHDFAFCGCFAPCEHKFHFFTSKKRREEILARERAEEEEVLELLRQRRLKAEEMKEAEEKAKNS